MTTQTVHLDITNCNWFQLFEERGSWTGRDGCLTGIVYNAWNVDPNMGPSSSYRVVKTYTPVNEARGDAIDLDPSNPYDDPVIVNGIDPPGEPWPWA